MTAVEYSKHLGKSGALLSLYRKNRGLPKKTSSVVIYNTYLAEFKRQEEARGKIQAMYYELKDGKNLRNFGLFLEANNVMTHKSFNVMVGRSFKSIERLIGIEHVEHYEKIIKLYEVWR